MKKIKTRNIEYVEVACDTAKDKLKIGDIEVLRGKKVKSVTAFRVDNVTKSPDGNALANANAFKCAYLKLRIKGKDRINEAPLSDFDSTLQNGKRWTMPEAVELDLTNSYITLGDKATQVNGEVFLLNFEFDELADDINAPSKEATKK